MADGAAKHPLAPRLGDAAVRDTARVRIGTWNLDGRWDDRHLDLLESLDCDVLLLTELDERAEIPGYTTHSTSQPMLPAKHWSAVLARGSSHTLPEPHPTTAMAAVDGIRCAASVLPWKGSARFWPGAGSSTTERTQHAVGAIAAAEPMIWGGDWNHSLSGPEWVGSLGGRSAIEESLNLLELQVPTSLLPHHLDGVLSIDPIAVPCTWTVSDTELHPAVRDGSRLSDHDAYVVVATPPDRAGPTRGD